MRFTIEPREGYLRAALDERRRRAGAPQDQGVYALWDGEELIYYGRGSIRARLIEHFHGRLDPLNRAA